MQNSYAASVDARQKVAVTFSETQDRPTIFPAANQNAAHKLQNDMIRVYRADRAEIYPASYSDASIRAYMKPKENE